MSPLEHAAYVADLRDQALNAEEAVAEIADRFVTAEANRQQARRVRAECLARLEESGDVYGPPGHGDPNLPADAGSESD